jgi:hypothetical protein
LARWFLIGMGAPTLPRLPFRLGLGRVWTPSFIFRPLRPICILVRTRTLFCFMYDLDLCMYIWIFWLVESLRLYYILLWVPLWTCVTVATLIPPTSCACCDVHEALGGAFPKRHHVDCGMIAIICKVPVLGRHMWYQRPGFVDTHWSSLPVG